MTFRDARTSCTPRVAYHSAISVLALDAALSEYDFVHASLRPGRPCDARNTSKARKEMAEWYATRGVELVRASRNVTGYLYDSDDMPSSS